MKKVTGVRFKRPGKIYYFDPENIKLEQGMEVIVDTSMGDELGEVVIAEKMVEDDRVTEPLKKVVRIATEKDKKSKKEYKAKEPEALRQIGVRDEVKRTGGNGICGRELCCCTFLGNFETVSIKMAKEQNISLNPSKISGNCGRLMCCLKYEQDVYSEKLSRLPKVGAIVKTVDGEGEVVSIETLKESIRVKFQDGDDSFFKKYDAKDIKIIKDAVNNDKVEAESEEELKELEELEKLEKTDAKEQDNI